MYLMQTKGPIMRRLYSESHAIIFDYGRTHAWINYIEQIQCSTACALIVNRIGLVTGVLFLWPQGTVKQFIMKIQPWRCIQSNLILNECLHLTISLFESEGPHAKFGSARQVPPKMKQYTFYKFFFDTARLMGIFDYDINPNTLQVKQSKGSKAHYFLLFNVFILAALWTRQLILFVQAVMTPGSLDLDIYFQALYLIAIAACIHTHIHQVLYGAEIAGLFTFLIQMKKPIIDYMPDLGHKIEPWYRTRLMHIRGCRNFWIVDIFASILFYYLYPEFPGFFQFSEENSILNSTISKIINGFADFYVYPCSWAGLFSLDLITGIISSQLNHFLNLLLIQTDQISNLEPNDPKSGQKVASAIKVYSRLAIFMSHFNETIGKAIIVHKALISTLMLFTLYGVVRFKVNLYISLFFLNNAIWLLIRTLVLLFPLANIQKRSQEVLKILKLRETQQEIVCLRQLVVSSGDVYKIDYDCMFNYINFVISYIQVIVQG